MTESTELALIPPRLLERGVTLQDRDGYRTLGIPPAIREQYNVIFPTVELSQSHEDFSPALREMQLSLERHAYTGATFHTRDECSLDKNGLLMLAEAAKIDIDTERIPTLGLGPTERLGWKAIATQRHADGTTIRQPGSATFDNEAQLAEITDQVASAKLYENGQRTNKLKFQPGSPEFTAEVNKRWRVKINKASELTETIAIERALRAMLKLPHKMKKTEFQKPWLVLCYQFLPRSPEARAEAARAMARLYGTGVDDAVPALSAPAATVPSPAVVDISDARLLDDEPATAEAEEVPAAALSTDGATDTSSVSPLADEPILPSDDDEPIQGEVVDESSPPEDLEALAEQAGQVKPPMSGMQDFTLAQIATKTGAEEWFKWAVTKDFSEISPTFNQHLRAFCAVHYPHLLQEGAPA